MFSVSFSIKGPRPGIRSAVTLILGRWLLQKWRIPIVFSIFFTTKGTAKCQSRMRIEGGFRDILLSRMVRTAHNFACSSCGLSSSGGLPFMEPPSARILSISWRSPLISDPPPDGIAESRSWRSEKVDWVLSPGPRAPPDIFLFALSSSAFRSVTDA